MGTIISLWKKKDEPVSEFERIFRPHLNYLYRIAYRFTGSTADAEDLVQEVLLKVLPKYQGIAPGKIRPWLAKVTYRTFIDRKRSFKRSPFSLLSFRDPRDDRDVVDAIQSTAPGPAEAVERKSANKSLMQALSMLNEEQRAVCIMHDMEGYTLAELVSICHAPLGTLKSRLSRARQRLKNIIGDGAFSEKSSSYKVRGNHGM
ncbi:RNA polymerase sigma factor [Thermodesulfobacteriota bacterium]